MRLTFKFGRPDAVFNSFLGFIDIKLGAEIVLLFGLINKVAGLYGLIVVLVGGSFTQLLFYAYSTASLFAFLWALRVVKSESATPSTTVSHLYTIDHLIQSAFHYLFYLNYWYIVPHDGRRNANSQAQQDLINLAASRGEIVDPAKTGDTDAMDELRKALAGEIWSNEKVFALWTLVFGVFLKVYFILILYSYAAHLRSSTYHTLPLTSRSKATQIAHPDPVSNGSSRAVDHQGQSQSQSGSAQIEAGSSGTNTAREDKVGKEIERIRAEEEEFTWD